MKTMFVIAGEHSGDALGGRLMAAMKDTKIEGIGGPLMQAQGLQSLVPMDELCVMGIVEVMKHYPRLRKLAFQIIEEIEQRQPDILLTIDLPDFNFAIAKQLKKRGKFKGKIIHYVAPSVWAWRPGRAKKISKFLDGLLCLFPFEPSYFTKHGLKAEFVGHSLIESGINQVDGSKFRKAERLNLGVLFGSRQGEFDRHSAIFKDVILKFPNVHIIAPTLPRLESQVRELLKDTDCTIITDPKDKWNAFASCDAAIAVSGTVGLELAYLGIPHIIAYKVNFLTWVLVKILVKTKYAHLANILLNKPVVPEFLQWDCEPEKIAAGLKEILENPEYQKQEFQNLKSMLGTNPSQKAAEFISAF